MAAASGTGRLAVANSCMPAAVSIDLEHSIEPEDAADMVAVHAVGTTAASVEDTGVQPARLEVLRSCPVRTACAAWGAGEVEQVLDLDFLLVRLVSLPLLLARRSRHACTELVYRHQRRFRQLPDPVYVPIH